MCGTFYLRRTFFFMQLSAKIFSGTGSHALSELICKAYGCQPGNYFANSASSYNWLYNLLLFNNGYHQEHHWDPKVHWTQMHKLHKEIAPQLAANHTRILRGPHITALIEDWLAGRPSARKR